MFDWGARETSYRIVSFPDDSSAIDFVFDSALVEKIYRAWNEGELGPLVDYGGGVKAITTKMLVEAGPDFLTGIKNIGKVRAEQILRDARIALDEVPYASGV